MHKKPLSIFLFLFVLSGNLSQAAETSKDEFTAYFGYGSFGPYPSVLWEHDLSESRSLYGGFTSYIDYKTLELDVGLTHTSGDWSISPGLGTTFGTGSWDLSTDKRQFIFRDIVPQIALSYSNARFEGEFLGFAWIPTQESRNTAVLFTYYELRFLAKHGGWGVGPEIQLVSSKEGRQAHILSELISGVHFLKDWKHHSFHFFLGYDSMRVDSYFGETKYPGASYSILYSYSFNP